jgi:hypothetical protein
MKSESRIIRLVLFLGLLVMVGAIALKFLIRTDKPEAQPVADVSKLVRTPTPPPESVRSATRAADTTNAEDENAEPNPLAIPREKADEFLAKHNRSAASLLAGYRALQDTNLLIEAAAKFPNDPQVQLAMLNSEILPKAERRKWLDAFKASSPENSLANYLSAAEYFNSGNKEAAIRELTEASGKKQYKNYAIEGMIDEQELRRYAGQSAFMAMHGNGWGGDLLREMSPMKQVANGIVEAQSQYVQSGDKESAGQLVDMGLKLANQLDTGEGGKFLISQMVGNGVEARMLQQLDQDTRYDSLGGKTPKERLDEMKQKKEENRKLMPVMFAAYGVLSEEEWQSYADRVKANGEREAMLWLQQRVTK